METGEKRPISMTFARGTTLQISGLKIPIKELDGIGMLPGQVPQATMRKRKRPTIGGRNENQLRSIN